MKQQRAGWGGDTAYIKLMKWEKGCVRGEMSDGGGTADGGDANETRGKK